MQFTDTLERGCGDHFGVRVRLVLMRGTSGHIIGPFLASILRNRTKQSSQSKCKRAHQRFILDKYTYPAAARMIIYTYYHLLRYFTRNISIKFSPANLQLYRGAAVIKNGGGNSVETKSE